MSGVAACGVWWMAGWCGQLGPGCHGWRASLRIWSRQSADGPVAGGVGFCLLFSAAACGAVLVSRSAARGRAAAGDWLRGLGDGHRAASPPESASGSSALPDAAAGGSRGPAVPAEPCAAGCVPLGCAATGPARSGSRRGGADGHAGCGALSSGWAVAAGRLGLAVPSASGAVVPDPGACRVSWAAGWAGRLPSHRVRRRGSSWRASWRSFPARSWSPSACAARAEMISRRAAMSLRCCCHSPARDGSSAAACSVSSRARSRSPALYAWLAATAARLACTRPLLPAWAAPGCLASCSRCAAASCAYRGVAWCAVPATAPARWASPC